MVSPSGEMASHAIDELDELCADRVAWPSPRPPSARDGSRDSALEEGGARA